MFIGEYDHAIDGKNRLSIPRKFRETLDSSDDPKGFFVTRGLDNCLFLFTKSQWDKVVERLESRPFTNEVARKFQRLFFSSAVYEEIDNQGRILIPDNLKAAIGLARNVSLVGVNARIEVWDRERWHSMKESSAGAYESMAQQLF